MCPTSGYSSRISSRARRSCAGLTKLNRNITAIDSAPSWRSRRTPARTASSSSAQQRLALEVEPLGDRDAAAAAGDRERRRVRRVPDLLLVHPAHLDLVAVALGDQQADGRAVLSRSSCCRRWWCRARRLRRPCRTHARSVPKVLGQLRDAGHHAVGLVVERGRGLVEHDSAVGRHADEVGERAADVDRRRDSRVVSSRGRAATSAGAALGPEGLGRGVVDREREVVERSR